MQNSITDRSPFVAVPVPREVIAEAGIDVDAPLQFTAADGKVTMENVPPDEADIVCDGDCERCPLHLLAGTGKYGGGL